MARSNNNLNAVLQDTANAIKAKKGSESPICPRDFADEVASIPTGITPTGTLNITENNVYDVTNYASANVNVPSATYTQQKLYYASSPNAVDEVTGAVAGHICFYRGAEEFVDGGSPNGNDLYVVDSEEETIERYSISNYEGYFAYIYIDDNGLARVETVWLDGGESTELYINGVKFILTRDGGGGSGSGE